MDKTEVIRVLESHVSVRKFTAEEVPEKLLITILRAACRAPTSSGLQAYSIIVIRDAETKQRLSVLAGNQSHVADTPVLLAICADLSRPRRACEMHQAPFAGENLEIGMVGIVDAALAGMCVMLAAESVGLGCVMIGGMRNNPVEVARLLELPQGAFVVFGMCLGWPLERPVQRPRLPENGAVHFEHFDSSKTDALLQTYDRLIQEQSPGIPTWTERIARDFSKPRRVELRRHLNRLGLPLE